MVAWAVVVALVVMAVVFGRSTHTPGLVTLALVTGLVGGGLVMLAPTPAGYDERADSDRIGGNAMADAGPPIGGAMFLVSMGCLVLSTAREPHDA